MKFLTICLAFFLPSMADVQETAPLVKLSSSRPVVRIPLRVNESPPQASVLRIPVTKVRNTRQDPLSVSVAVVQRKPPGRRWPIGVFSVYPPEQPGVFHLNVPPEALTRLRQPAPAEIELRLERRPDGSSPQAVEIDIGKLALITKP